MAEEVGKNEFVAELAKNGDLTKAGAEKIYNHVFSQLIGFVTEGCDVSVPGLGKFKLVERAARKGRNPKTGKAINIAACTTLRFKPAAGIKRAVK